MALTKKPTKLREAQGAGDVVAVLAKALGIEMKEDCGCEERRKKLNKAFPFKKRGT